MYVQKGAFRKAWWAHASVLFCTDSKLIAAAGTSMWGSIAGGSLLRSEGDVTGSETRVQPVAASLPIKQLSSPLPGLVLLSIHLAGAFSYLMLSVLIQQFMQSKSGIWNLSVAINAAACVASLPMKQLSSPLPNLLLRS